MAKRRRGKSEEIYRRRMLAGLGVGTRRQAKSKPQQTGFTGDNSLAAVAGCATVQVAGTLSQCAGAIYTNISREMKDRFVSPTLCSCARAVFQPTKLGRNIFWMPQHNPWPYFNFFLPPQNALSPLYINVERGPSALLGNVTLQAVFLG